MKLSESKSLKRRDCDFKALELKLNEDSVFSHTIYIKEHSVREHTEDKPSGKTLFIVNVPPLADENGIRNAFSEAGAIKSVQFCNKPGAQKEKISKKFVQDNSDKISFRVAYVVFKKVFQLDKALKLTQLRAMNSSDHQIKSGIRKWTEEYNSNILQTNIIKEKVQEFMKDHDNEIKKAEAREKELEKEDDEGWVTVTKRGNVQSFARTEKVENKILAKEEKNKKRKELKNFYTFQIRESKMKHIVALRQKFEEDKKKIAQIKQSRRFRPF